MNSSPQQNNSPPDFSNSFPQSAVESAGDIQAAAHPQVPALEVRPHAPQSSPRFRQAQSQYYIVFSVTGIERSNVRNPIIRFDAKVSCNLSMIVFLAEFVNQTNLPRFRAPLVRDIRRTHHELVKLQDHLIYANPECFVPALPPPATSAGAGTEEDERRMKGELQRWFDILSTNSVLIRDEEIMLFVESDFGVYLAPILFTDVVPVFTSP
jgi:hypothetical protein